MGTSEGAQKRLANPAFREKFKNHSWHRFEYGKGQFGHIPDGFEKRLLILIESGTTTTDIYYHFLIERRMSRPSVMSLFATSGVYFRLPESGDEISDARRLELQLLSISE
jgi:hypothetical protein